MQSARSFWVGFHIQKHTLLWIALLLAMFVLVLSRVYLLEKSIFFQNDIGRDYSILEDWRRTGKPPLLGPQTNFIPFNHSPVYFYILYPFFLLLDGSPVATAWAAAFHYVAALFLAIFFVLKAGRTKALMPISFFLLVAVGHPQLVTGGRYVWNPTFVPLLTFLSLLALFEGIESKRKQGFFWAGMLVGAAAGFNLSVLPLILGILAALFFAYRGYILRFCSGFVVGVVALYTPIIAFEVRHEWQISRRLMASVASTTGGGEMFPQLTLVTIRSVWEYISGTSGIVAVLVALCLIVGMYLTVREREERKTLFWWQIVAISLAILICLPLKLESYYYLPIVSAFFFAVAVALPQRIQLLMALMFIGSWGLVWQRGGYTSTPLRTATAVYTCGDMVCKQLKGPTTVAVTAGFHGYHAGPEFQYVLKKSGCQVQPVFDPASTARTLVVFADQTAFSFPKDSFEEVRSFAPTTTESVIQCPEGITAHVLSK